MHWRLGRLDIEGPHGWHKLLPDKLAYLIAQLGHWEQVTDGELFGMQGNGPVPQDELCKEAQERLTELQTDDVDELWHLRLSGKERIWGTRRHNTFALLWWDPDHEVAPSKKKHT